VPVDAVEVWRQDPDTGAYTKAQPYGLSAAGTPVAAIDLVADAAATLRDSAERRRVSGTATTWIGDWTRWRMGDAVKGIAGRNISFRGTPDATDPRYPEIVQLRLQLKGPSATDGDLDQAITVSIDDTAFGVGAAAANARGRRAR